MSIIFDFLKIEYWFAKFFIMSLMKKYSCSLYMNYLTRLIIITNQFFSVKFSSVTQSCPTLCDPMNHSTPGLLVHHQLPEFTQTHVHPTISSSVVPFSSCPQSFPASGSFPMSQLFASGGQNIGVSASTSVLPINTQDWSPLGWTGGISLQSTLKEMGIPDHLTCFLRNLYAGQEATVRTGHGTKDWFQIGKGVRQGCILSPYLFNL